MGETITVQVNFAGDVYEALQKFAESRQSTCGEAIRDLVQWGEVIQWYQSHGNTFHIETPDEMREITFK